MCTVQEATHVSYNSDVNGRLELDVDNLRRIRKVWSITHVLTNL